jgi:sortase A
MSRRWLRRFAPALLTVGAVCTGYVAVTLFEIRTQQADYNRELDAMIARRATEAAGFQLPVALANIPVPDPSTSPLHEGDLVGRIEIQRLGLSAIVLQGTAATTLEAAVGHLPATALPGQRGNAVLAGHRDTFFRQLRDIQAGDEIMMKLPVGDYYYEVKDISVVTPEDVWVTNDTAASVLTLVTCFPFKYVGPAPSRFAVRAVKTNEAVPSLTAIGEEPPYSPR